MVNLSGTERWRELCRLLDIDDGGLDYSSPEGLSKLSDREWNRTVLQQVIAASRAGPPTSGRRRCWPSRPRWPSATHSRSGWRSDQASVARWWSRRDDPVFGRVPLVPDRPDRSVPAGAARPPARCGAGALGGHRVIDLSNFWAGPLAARLLAELGADVVKVEPPGGEGAYQLVPVLPNIYVDANRSKRGVVLDLRTAQDRARLLDLVAASDVVVENAVAGTWERLGARGGPRCGPSTRARSTPGPRASGDGPLASRPWFDYVVQAATGMEMTQGVGPAAARQLHGQRLWHRAASGGRDRPGAAGAGAGRAVTSVEASLMMTATVFQSEEVAALAVRGAARTPSAPDSGAPVGCHLRAEDGWVMVCV